MIIIMKPGASEEAVQKVSDLIRSRGLQAHLSKGAEVTIVGVVGDKTRLPQMLRETCVAELTHWLLCVAGLHCLTLWPSVGGLAVVCLNILGNLPFILIQRYNRPRLARLLEKTCGTAAPEQEACRTD